MDCIGSFITIKGRDWYFNGCSTCQGFCCDGAYGFSLAPLILEDFEAVYRYFPIVFSFLEDTLGVFVLLNDGKNQCRYFENKRCSIYDHRPPACRLYPVSPYFEHLLVDTKCPSLSRTEGRLLCKNGVLESAFYTKRLENFVAKKEETRLFLERMNDRNDFEYIGKIADTSLYVSKHADQNRYLKMHAESLKFLTSYMQVSFSA
ncbi:MAG: YkgJ family cysteine cluster protein [Sulfurospirillum cavolei]|nr:YkgJ family cysteine cluster protein [Sulfurospirillum cavolei]